MECKVRIDGVKGQEEWMEGWLGRIDQVKGYDG